MNGKAVQLIGGKTKVLEVNNPLELVNDFSRFGTLHIVDLDAAFGKGNNLELIKQILEFTDARVGGGIRSVEDAKRLIKCGAEKVIIGTKANKQFLTELIKEIPREKIAVAVDVRKGLVSVEGWQTDTNIEPLQLVRELEELCSEFILTCIDKEGKMQGLDWELINKLKKATGNTLSVAGGISTLKEIKKLEENGMNSVVGMALYAKKLKLEDVFISQLKFTNGLIPTITQDATSKDVLMLAYSNKDSLKKTFETGACWYWSRSRNKLWMKGESSRNTQKLITARYDCDKDSVLFLVRQKGNACHTGKYSCFGNKSSDVTFLVDLLRILKSRAQASPKESYTKKLLGNRELLLEKINEESSEVIDAVKEGNKKDIIWEISDLLYFIMVLMVSKKVVWKEIINELQGRRKPKN